MQSDLNSLTQLLHISFLFKLGISIILIIFLIFLTLIYIQVRSLNRILSQAPYSTLVEVFSILLILAALALIAVTLVIL